MRKNGNEIMVLQHIKFLMALIGFSLVTGGLYAEESAADIEAMTEIGDQIADWWDSLPREKPQSLSILDINGTNRFSHDFFRVSEGIILGSFAKNKSTTAISCLECRRPEIVVKDDRLIITKGIPNQERLQALAQKLELDSFVTIFISKTFHSLKVLVTVQQAATGGLLFSKEFSVASVALYDSGMHFAVASGLQWDLVPLRPKRSATSIAFGLDLAWLQSMGRYSRFGIGLGGLFLGQSGNLGYIMPRAAWKFQLGRSVFSLMPTIQAGFGFRIRSTTDAIKNQELSFGFPAGLGLDLFIGDFFFIGAKTNAYLPMNLPDFNDFTVYPGFHLGISIGG